MALVETLLRLQSAAQAARRTIGESTGILAVPGANALLMQIELLETEYAQMIARSVGAIPMANGGLVTQPTFALIGEAGPEMVIPVKKKKRKVSKYQRIWGKELKKIKNTSRLKDGSYRKGWDQSKEFSKAHKATKKMLK